jgi:probable HAF family extracellular repeat protein
VTRELGTVVGTSLTAEGKPHVFVWKPGESALTDLGAGVPVAINARGDVIGYTGPRAILWRVK